MLLYQVFFSVLLVVLLDPTNASVLFNWDLPVESSQRGLQTLEYSLKFVQAEERSFWHARYYTELIGPCGQSGRIYTQIEPSRNPYLDKSGGEHTVYAKLYSYIEGSKPMRENCRDNTIDGLDGVDCGHFFDVPAEGHEFRIMLSFKCFKEVSVVTALLVINDQEPQIIGEFSVNSGFTGMNSKEQGILDDYWRIENNQCNLRSPIEAIFYPVKEFNTSTTLATFSNFTIEARSCPDAFPIKYTKIDGNAIQIHG